MRRETKKLEMAMIYRPSEFKGMNNQPRISCIPVQFCLRRLLFRDSRGGESARLNPRSRFMYWRNPELLLKLTAPPPVPSTRLPFVDVKWLIPNNCIISSSALAALPLLPLLPLLWLLLLLMLLLSLVALRALLWLRTLILGRPLSS